MEKNLDQSIVVNQQMRQSLEKREEMTNKRQMKDQELSTKRDIESQKLMQSNNEE